MSNHSEVEADLKAPREPPGWAPRVAIGLLLLVTAFQVALVAGAPLGRFSWGGRHDGVLPTGLRLSSAVSACVLLGLVALMATGPTTTARRRALRAASALCALGTVANAISPSLGERLTWAPVAAILASCFWLRARTGNRNARNERTIGAE